VGVGGQVIYEMTLRGSFFFEGRKEACLVFNRWVPQETRTQNRRVVHDWFHNWRDG
jgi:hypothetical protein